MMNCFQILFTISTCAATTGRRFELAQRAVTATDKKNAGSVLDELSWVERMWDGRVSDTTGNERRIRAGPGAYRSPRRTMPCNQNSRTSGPKCLSMTWRAISACPWSQGLPTVRESNGGGRSSVDNDRHLEDSNDGMAAGGPSPVEVTPAEAKAGTSGYCSPRHRMPLNSVNKGSNCVG
jgi:hypothetical protein